MYVYTYSKNIPRKCCLKLSHEVRTIMLQDHPLHSKFMQTRTAKVSLNKVNTVYCNSCL